MFSFTPFLKKGYEHQYESSSLRTKKFDMLLTGMSLLYLFYWFGSLVIEVEDHGAFFDHIGLITLLYLTVTTTSLLTKIGLYHRLLAAVSFSALAFLLSFPTFDLYISLVIAIVIAILGIIRPLETNFVTGTMIGYWGVLLFTSSLQYNLSEAKDKGFIATIFELLTILFNAGDFTVLDQALSGFGLIFVLFFGYLFALKFNGKVEKVQENKKIPKLKKKTVTEKQEQNKNGRSEDNDKREKINLKLQETNDTARNVDRLTVYTDILGADPSHLDKVELEIRLVEALKKWNKRINAPSLERRQEAERMLAIIDEMQKLFL